MTASLVPPAIDFQGRCWSSAEVTDLATGWWRAVRAQQDSAGGASAMVFASHPESVALFFALSALDRPLALLPSDPRAWSGAPRPVPGFTFHALPSQAHLASAAQSLGLRVAMLSGPQLAATGPPPPFLACPGIVTFTSGSTGLRKPAYRTTASVLAGVGALMTGFEVPRGGGILTALPLGGTHGLTHGVLAATWLGGRLGLLERFDHRTTLAGFASGAYDYWPCTPFLADLLVRCPLPDRPEAPRVCAAAGNLVSVGLLRAFGERFGVPLGVTYGTTEAGTITVERVPLASPAPESVGRPAPGIRVRIGETPGAPEPPGRPGRVWVASPWYMEGYGLPPDLRRPEYVDGWWATGDMGELDAEGYLRLLGRVDDWFKTASDHLVNPVEVVAALRDHPGVREAVVVPLTAPAGIVLGALVEASSSVSPTDLRRYVAGLLPIWAQPSVLDVTPTLPRLANGKPDRMACIAVLERVGPRARAT